MLDALVLGVVITNAVMIIGVVGAGSWKIATKLGDQNKAIGKIDGKVDGVCTRLDGIDTRIDRIDSRINGYMERD